MRWMLSVLLVAAVISQVDKAWAQNSNDDCSFFASLGLKNQVAMFMGYRLGLETAHPKLRLQSIVDATEAVPVVLEACKKLSGVRDPLVKAMLLAVGAMLEAKGLQSREVEAMTRRMFGSS